MGRRQRLLAFWLFGAACLWAGEAPTGVLIARYRVAECVPFAARNRISGDAVTREWHEVLTLRDGSKVVVEGAGMVGGTVAARFLTDGKTVVAADAGDYVYPYDVRFDRNLDLLYVVARGLLGGLFQRTYLFEYDLRARRLLVKRRVRDRDLPPVCADSRRR